MLDLVRLAWTWKNLKIPKKHMSVRNYLIKMMDLVVEPEADLIHVF